MSKRERYILIGAMVIAGLWLFDSLVLGPWLDAWDVVTAKVYKQEKELEDAEMLLTREVEVARDWKEIETQLTAEDRSDTVDALVIHMNKLGQKAGVKIDDQLGRRVEHDDFIEFSLELSLQTDIEGLRNLLVELYNSEEYLKVGRLTVGSQPFDKSRASRLDINLKVSTIEYKPSHGKKNGRNGGR